MVSKATLRKDVISKGRESLYIQYYPAIRDKYTNKLVQRETLNIYIYQNPKTDIERFHNKNCMEKAMAIVASRTQSLINEEYGFLEKHRLNEDFLRYFYDHSIKKGQKWMYALQHFIVFMNGECRFKDVTVETCEKFKHFLLHDAKMLRREGKLEHNSACGYFATFRAMLTIAFRDRRLKEDVNAYLEPIKWKETKREYLSLEEVKLLIATPCKIPVLKSASIFAILTGLRVSDILQLQWDQIRHSEQQGGWYMSIITQKTKTPTEHHISEETLEWCGPRDEGKVFKGLERSMVQFPLQHWMKDAGIDRHVTFYGFRHTYATIQYSLGTDIYTVKDLLTHKSISTTQVYAQIINKKKIEAANRISLKE